MTNATNGFSEPSASQQQEISKPDGLLPEASERPALNADFGGERHGSAQNTSPTDNIPTPSDSGAHGMSQPLTEPNCDMSFIYAERFNELFGDSNDDSMSGDDVFCNEIESKQTFCGADCVRLNEVNNLSRYVFRSDKDLTLENNPAHALSGSSVPDSILHFNATSYDQAAFDFALSDDRRAVIGPIYKQRNE